MYSMAKWWRWSYYYFTSWGYRYTEMYGFSCYAVSFQTMQVLPSQILCTLYILLCILLKLLFSIRFKPLILNTFDRLNCHVVSSMKYCSGIKSLYVYYYCTREYFITLTSRSGTSIQLTIVHKLLEMRRRSVPVKQKN